MCGRLNIVMTPAMVAYVSDLGVSVSFRQQWNVAPTESVPMIYEEGGKRRCDHARWWLVPAWSEGPSSEYAMFNARAETLEKSRAYRGPFKHQRCVIPASSFFEWKKTGADKIPIEIYREDKPLLLAGLWDRWGELLSCSIVTTQAASSFERIHDRMPVMLNRAAAQTWLSAANPPEALRPLLASHLPYPLLAREVEPEINNARHKVQAHGRGEASKLI